MPPVNLSLWLVGVPHSWVDEIWESQLLIIHCRGPRVSKLVGHKTSFLYALEPVLPVAKDGILSNPPVSIPSDSIITTATTTYNVSTFSEPPTSVAPAPQQEMSDHY